VIGNPINDPPMYNGFLTYVDSPLAPSKLAEALADK
jgi:hypothetical protein